MTAQDYPVTFGYGATDGVYYGPNGSIGPYHRGDDRAMPYGTPVVVNGVVIGLSGDGNGAYGPHLHVGEFIGGLDVNPHGAGFTLDGARVHSILNDYSDPVNGKYVRIIDSAGEIWVYLHMSQLNVTPGQELKGGTMPPVSVQIPDALTIQLAYNIGLDRQPSDKEVASWNDKTVEQLMRTILESDEHKALQAGAGSVKPYSGPTLFTKS